MRSLNWKGYQEALDKTKREKEWHMNKCNDEQIEELVEYLQDQILIYPCEIKLIRSYNDGSKEKTVV